MALTSAALTRQVQVAPPLSLNVRAQQMSERFIEIVSAGRWRYAGISSAVLLCVAIATTVIALIKSAYPFAENVASYLALWAGSAALLAFLYGQTIWLAPNLKFPATKQYLYARSFIAIAALMAFMWGIFGVITYAS